MNSGHGDLVPGDLVPEIFGMKRAIPRTMLSAALVAAALAGFDAAVAQTVAPPAAEATLPPAAAPPPADAAPPPASNAPGPIAALQQQLKREGFAPGPVNGVMTEQTRRALDDYQRRRGRPPGGLAATAAGNVGADPVRRVQADLQRLGLFAGPVDGVVGPATRDAIIRFEAARHLAVDPRVSDNLLAALGAASASPGTAPPSSPGSIPQAAPATAPATPAPEATGRRQLPPGVNPPPIR
jgi:peptidoglycan hydrolase-like protein with peptidoglycan-binding domain